MKIDTGARTSSLHAFDIKISKENLFNNTLELFFLKSKKYAKFELEANYKYYYISILNDEIYNFL